MKLLFERRFCWLEIIVAMIIMRVTGDLLDVRARHLSIENHKLVEIDKSQSYQSGVAECSRSHMNDRVNVGSGTTSQ